MPIFLESRFVPISDVLKLLVGEDMCYSGPEHHRWHVFLSLFLIPICRFKNLWELVYLVVV